MTFLRLQEMAQPESSTNEPSLEPIKRRQHNMRMTVLSFFAKCLHAPFSYRLYRYSMEAGKDKSR